MTAISDDECEAWLTAMLQEPFSWAAVDAAYRRSVTYVIPSDAGRKTALARTLSGVMESNAERLLWITQWGVFPSTENAALFDGYRRALGEDRPLSSLAAGHVLHGPGDELECLLDLVLYFFWDASVFCGRSIWLRLSHDEVFSIHARDERTLTACEKALAPYELREVSRSTGD